MEQVTKKVTEAMDKCQFNVATDEIRKFTWHSFCDNYIEAVKHKLYQQETYGEEKRTAAQYTLYNAIYRIIQLLAPISPHIAEELYQIMFKDDKSFESIHVSLWPAIQENLVDKKAEEKGDLIVAVMAEIRRDKAENHKPLNSIIQKLTLFTNNEEKAATLADAKEDLSGTLKVEQIYIRPKGTGREVKGYADVYFAAEY
jgi:valyl-tRNA synthetase